MDQFFKMHFQVALSPHFQRLLNNKKNSELWSRPKRNMTKWLAIFFHFWANISAKSDNHELLPAKYWHSRLFFCLLLLLLLPLLCRLLIKWRGGHGMRPCRLSVGIIFVPTLIISLGISSNQWEMIEHIHHESLFDPGPGSRQRLRAMLVNAASSFCTGRWTSEDSDRLYNYLLLEAHWALKRKQDEQRAIALHSHARTP